MKMIIEFKGAPGMKLIGKHTSELFKCYLEANGTQHGQQGVRAANRLGRRLGGLMARTGRYESP
jgi:hypothetical protein